MNLLFSLLFFAMFSLTDAAPWTRLHGFGPPSKWATFPFPEQTLFRVGDVDGNGLDDIVAFHRSAMTGGAAGDVYVLRNMDGRFGEPEKWHDFFCVSAELPLV